VPHIVQVSEDPREDRAALVARAEGFVGTICHAPAHALIVLGPETASDFDRTQAWAEETFLELWVVFQFLGAEAAHRAKGQALFDALDRHVSAVKRPELVDSAGLRPARLVRPAPGLRPLLGCGREMLLAACLAPMYPEGHPRHAARRMVVVTWGRDVAQAPGPIVRAIRRAAWRAFGCAYDADDLVLALRPDASGR
jgi:hypothetical protein